MVTNRSGDPSRGPWPRRKGSRKRDGCPNGTSQPQRAAVRGTEAGSKTGAAQAEWGFEDSKDRSQGPHPQQCSCRGSWEKGTTLGFYSYIYVPTCLTARWKSPSATAVFCLGSRSVGRTPCRDRWSRCLFSPPSRSLAPELVVWLNGRALA